MDNKMTIEDALREIDRYEHEHGKVPSKITVSIVAFNQMKSQYLLANVSEDRIINTFRGIPLEIDDNQVESLKFE